MKGVCRAWQYLHAWVDAVEALGFVFLKHQLLEKSHALAFATRAMSATELQELPTEVELSPPMRMRSEDHDSEVVCRNVQ